MTYSLPSTRHLTNVLALATAPPSSASLRPYGCLSLRASVRWWYRDGEHRFRPSGGFASRLRRESNREQGFGRCQNGTRLARGEAVKGLARRAGGHQPPAKNRRLSGLLWARKNHFEQLLRFLQKGSAILCKLDLLIALRECNDPRRDCSCRTCCSS